MRRPSRGAIPRSLADWLASSIKAPFIDRDDRGGTGFHDGARAPFRLKGEAALIAHEFGNEESTARTSASVSKPRRTQEGSRELNISASAAPADSKKDQRPSGNKGGEEKDWETGIESRERRRAWSHQSTSNGHRDNRDTHQEDGCATSFPPRAFQVAYPARNYSLCGVPTARRTGIKRYR